MKYKFTVLLSLLFLALGCAHSNTSLTAQPQSKKIQITGHELIYNVYDSRGEEGQFLFSTINLTSPIAYPLINNVIALKTNGEIAYKNSFKFYTNAFLAAGLKPVSHDMYGYFVGFVRLNACCVSNYFFLDKDFNHVIPFPLALQLNMAHKLDFHSMAVGAQGTYFFMYRDPDVSRDVVEYKIQEYDTNGRQLFSWETKKNIFQSQSKKPFKDPDLNFFALQKNGNLVVSLRELCEVLEIEYPSGKILERISSNTWSFENDPHKGFCYQHSTHILDNDHLLVFDNGNGSYNSRAVEYALDRKNKKATLVWQYEARAGDPHRTYAGSVQRLKNGNTLIAWGFAVKKSDQPNYQYPLFSEISPDGKIVREVLSTEILFTPEIVFDYN